MERTLNFLKKKKKMSSLYFTTIGIELINYYGRDIIILYNIIANFRMDDYPVLGLSVKRKKIIIH